MDFLPFFTELVKIGTISDEEAAHALKRYESLKENKPELGQVARYSALGAVAAPAIGAVENRIRGEGQLLRPAVGRGTGRALAGKAVAGAVGMGLVPIARHWMDQSSERSKLKSYMRQHAIQHSETDSPGE
jgi:hypothetical protein